MDGWVVFSILRTSRKYRESGPVHLQYQCKTHRMPSFILPTILCDIKFGVKQKNALQAFNTPKMSRPGTKIATYVFELYDLICD